MDVSIIIVSYNTWFYLQPCLETIRRNTKNLSYEILVVDNASSDGSQDKIRKYHKEVILLENEENMGFAKANNQALEIAKGDYIFLLNADTLILNDGITRALEYSKRNDIAIIAPRLLNRDKTLQKSFSRYGGLSRYIANTYLMAVGPAQFLMRREETPEQPDENMQFLLGAAMLIDRKVINRLGLFDEYFYFTGEERDLCMRYISAGERLCYFPSWVILHYGGSGNPHSVFQLENWVKSAIGIAYKHGGWFSARLMRLGLVLFLLSYRTRFAIKGMISNRSQDKETARVYSQVLWKFMIRRPFHP